MLESVLDSFSFLLSWRFLAIGYGVLTLRYVVIAGGAALVFYGWRRERRIESKIQSRWPRRSDYRREIGYSMLTFVVFLIVGIGLLRGPFGGYTHFYGEIAEYGWPWFIGVPSAA